MFAAEVVLPMTGQDLSLTDSLQWDGEVSRRKVWPEGEGLTCQSMGHGGPALPVLIPGCTNSATDGWWQIWCVSVLIGVTPVK